MIDSLANMWNKSKLAFFLLLPFVILAIGIKLYQEYQYQMAKQSLEKAKKESAARKARIAEQEKQAKDTMKKANEASDRRKAREESEKLNLDWHKKKK